MMMTMAMNCSKTRNRINFCDRLGDPPRIMLMRPSSSTNATAPQNLALASKGTTVFGSSEYGHGVHFLTNVIDGLYGDTFERERWHSSIQTPHPHWVEIKLPKPLFQGTPKNIKPAPTNSTTARAISETTRALRSR